MSEKSELQSAINLALRGVHAEARDALLELEPRIRDPQLRLLLIDAALTVLDPLKDNVKKVALASEGSEIAESFGLVDLQAHFRARAADGLMFQVTIRRHEMSKLKLAPRWIEFATEIDKRDYESLASEVQKLEKEIDYLLSQAVAQAESSGNKRVFGYVLISKGAIESSRYLQCKSDCLRGTGAKLWVKFRFMRYPILEQFLFTSEDSRKLKRLVNSFTSSLLKAGKLLEEIGDGAAGAAYYNLANDLNSAYHFRQAKKCLARAKSIALKANDFVLIKQIDDLEQIIKTKNESIPDYLNGETRKSKNR